MKIKITLEPDKNASDMMALLALAKATGAQSIPEGEPHESFDRGSGPLRKFDPTQVTVWSTEENGELARQRLNITDDVESVAFNTIPKGYPEKSKPEPKKPKPEPKKPKPEPEKPKPEKSKPEKSKPEPEKPKKSKQPKRSTPAEPSVEVKTDDVDATGTIDDALNELDPPAPEKAEDDDKARVRKLRAMMVKVVQAYGSPEGAKAASKIVGDVAGVKDITKIPVDKTEDVIEALQAAIEAMKGAAPYATEDVDY